MIIGDLRISQVDSTINQREVGSTIILEQVEHLMEIVFIKLNIISTKIVDLMRMTTTATMI